MAKKSTNGDSPNPTVAFRIPAWALSYYQEIAIKERRNLSQVLRIVLEDHAKGRIDGGGRRQRVA